MGKNILITGATGMVGSYVLRYLLDEDEVASVLSIGRRKTGLVEDKLTEIVHDDFLNFTTIKNQLTNLHACIYCLGTYQNQVSLDDFYKITCDYQKALTDVLEETSPNLTFTLFGADGASRKEKGLFAFPKAKGRAENLLLATKFPRKHIFRPGYIHPTGNRKPPGLIYKLTLPIGRFAFCVFPPIGITDYNLANAMVNATLNADFDKEVVRHGEAKRIAKNGLG